jgi:uncharacterized protein YecE (DUF72 family)
MPPDLERFRAFFELLPRDTRAAAKLAQQHDERLEGRSFLRSHQRQPLRHTVELRNPDGMTRAFLDLLRAQRIGWVVADTAGRWPYAEHLTSDFVYVRLHGDKALYQGGYSKRVLSAWAERIARWHAHGDVYVYFDNDIGAHAPFDALALQRACGLGTFQADAPLAGRTRPRKLHVHETPRTGGFIKRRAQQPA